MPQYPTVIAVLIPCAICGLVDVLTMPDTDPTTVACRECIVDGIVETLVDVTMNDRGAQ